jgi:osmoprotectant transport system substrate-binding protein
MRFPRTAALGAATLAVILAACSSGGSTPSPSTAPSASAQASPSGAAASPSGGPTIASTMTLGGPPECPQRDYCEAGLESVYGLTFKDFKPLDAGGPLTVAALEGGQIDVGLLFTSDPSIAAKGFVLLQDDKQLQKSDNIVPIIRKAVLDASPEVAGLLNGVTAKLTQDGLTSLNKQVAVDKVDPADAAGQWLKDNGFTPVAGASDMGKVVVASFNFPESTTLAELYAQVLEMNGFSVDRKLNLGNREVVYPALRAGQIDLLPEYLASALTVAYQGDASTDPATTAAALTQAAQADGLVVLDYASATDQNGFVVTKATADKYGLTKISDLARPAP